MKIAVLASGGVDSSVALMRLAEEGGHELTAFYLKIWLEDEMAFLGSCPWEEDLEQVRAVCERAGVPLEVIIALVGLGLIVQQGRADVSSHALPEREGTHRLAQELGEAELSRFRLDLAEAGRDVVLIDKAAAIGGLMTRLDRTFPTNNCAM